MYMYFVLTCHSTVFGLHLPVCFFRTLIFGRSTAHTHTRGRAPTVTTRGKREQGLRESQIEAANWISGEGRKEEVYILCLVRKVLLPKGPPDLEAEHE
uniref:Putative secreted protein n=1 Tax=Anopheles darlingi TaxID=43151 RepID=A0A2M4DF36_ANODA